MQYAVYASKRLSLHSIAIKASTRGTFPAERCHARFGFDLEHCQILRARYVCLEFGY